MTFDQTKYWTERHEKFRGDPRSVGDMRRSREENEKGQQDLKQIMSCIASRLDGRSVLDLGCGWGRAAAPFISAGFEYHGVDVSPLAIEQARAQNPNGYFFVADLNQWEPHRTYDIVCALYVFVHFVDEQNWRRILAAAANAVSTGGSLVIADDFPIEREVLAAHVVVRPLAEYCRMLEKSGFKWDERFSSRLTHDIPNVGATRQFQRFVSERGTAC